MPVTWEDEAMDVQRVDPYTDEGGHRLVGRETGYAYRLGDPVEARLSEADPISGSLVLELMDAGPAGGARRGGRGPKTRPRGAAGGRRRGRQRRP